MCREQVALKDIKTIMIVAGIVLATFTTVWTFFAKRLDWRAHTKSRLAGEALYELDSLIALANTALKVIDDRSPIGAPRNQASPLWTLSSAVLLARWRSRCSVLHGRRRHRDACQAFEQSFVAVREAAVKWHNADLAWRQQCGIIEGEIRVGGVKASDNTLEATVRHNAVCVWSAAYEGLLTEHQALRGILQKWIISNTPK